LSSERPNHRMFEQWHPLGVVGIISAFNFPAAVWAWNSLLAAITGNTMIWKPSARTPLTSIAVHKILEPILLEHQTQGVFHLCVTEGHLGANWMARDVRIPMVSATGSSQMGREVGSLVAQRLGKTLLELGGNNAAILTPSANCGLALRAVVFAAVGTAGQRCTTLRRLFVHCSMEKEFVEKLVGAYRSIRIGNPWESDTLMGPLISEQAVTNMLQAIDLAKSQGAKLLHGGKRLDRAGYFVEPAIFKADPSMDVVARETFAPILYVMPYENLRDAIRYQNAVSQGLSSAIFTEQLTEMEEFLSASGSDCGIANVNMGTSGAEIGGSFGGEKESGGGREAGADSWKNYMRRQTCTINYGKDLPLSQGVRFDL
ncbi:MAG: aldehyde dehydrogenase family protein, partial [Planctomycetia bacterium]